VREAWNGLGYYARARNLHAAARHVVDRLGGVLPERPGDLRRLPGIGRYTAGAVASIVFGANVAALDTNAARVLARVLGVRRTGGAARHQARLWRLAEALVPRGRAGDWNQALMDLGATVCTARGPCCAAFRVGRRARQVEARVVGAEGPHRLGGGGRAAGPRGRDGDRDRVALEHGCARAGGADRCRVGSDPSLTEPPENLRRLGCHLLLLLRNVRDQVVDDVERDDARRAAGARQALHRRHEHPLQAEAVEQRLERDG